MNPVTFRLMFRTMAIMLPYLYLSNHKVHQLHTCKKVVEGKKINGHKIVTHRFNYFILQIINLCLFYGLNDTGFLRSKCQYFDMTKMYPSVMLIYLLFYDLVDAKLARHSTKSCCWIFFIFPPSHRRQDLLCFHMKDWDIIKTLSRDKI